MIRKIEDTFIINLILTKKINLTKLENLLKLNKIKYSIYFCISQNNLPKKPVFFVGGASEVVTNEFGINYPVYPMSFIQVNEEVKNIVYKKILSLINENDIVVDAYSGAGLLSAIISQKVKKVFAIEIEEQATNACKKLIDLNSIKNLFAINGDCAIEVPSILQREKIDVIIMDPARKGVDDSTLESIVLAKPKKIIYLSCNPSTLVRDLKIICEKENYKINFVQPYDMFPQTSEVETLVELILE